MRITFFFRQRSPVYHSIEKLFQTIISNISDFETISQFSTHPSKGFINRIKIGIEARNRQSAINHITGDIHFISLFLKKSRTILTIHDIGILNEGNFLKRFIIKKFWFDWPIRRVTYLTVISEFTRCELMRACKVPPEKIFVINNCIAENYQYFPKEIITETPAILHIGTKSNKNLTRLINAIENINCKLLIVGKLNTEQLSLLENKNIVYENYVNLSQPELLALYVKSDILAYVSTYEGFGMPLVEANAVGRPVLSSNIEPIRSVASDAALLVDPFNENEIREGIKRIITDNVLRNRLIKNGLENAKKYRAKKVANQYSEVYKLLLNKKNEKNPHLY